MSAEASITAALMAHLDAMTLSPALDVQKPNEHFEPTIGETYLKADEIMVPTMQPGLSHDSTKHYGGILQISVYSPRNTGIPGPKTISGQVADHFARGTRMTSGGVTVEIGPVPPTVGTPLQEAAWHQTPVSIRYFALV